ncbi:MAG TPA: hypothetical protein V6D22_21475 [Candidatus Obscuribacterales bacterium]
MAQPRLALAYSRATGGPIAPGTWVACRLVVQEPGGFNTVMLSDGSSGFLPTNMPVFAIGDIVWVQFVCRTSRRTLLAPIWNAERQT